MSNTKKPLAFLLSSTFADKYPHRLAAGFPHVMQKLEEYWNDSDALTEYFSELMVSKRPGRRGFPPEVGAEILSLSLAYDRIGAIKPVEQERRADAKGAVGDAWSLERAVNELDRLNIPRTMAGFARAAEAGNEHVCRLFLHAGFDVNARDSREWTPLMVASFNGSETLAIELIKLGASVHAQDADGYTPLHWGTFNGHAQVVHVLGGEHEGDWPAPTRDADGLALGAVDQFAKAILGLDGSHGAHEPLLSELANTAIIDIPKPAAPCAAVPVRDFSLAALPAPLCRWC